MGNLRLQCSVDRSRADVREKSPLIVVEPRVLVAARWDICPLFVIVHRYNGLFGLRHQWLTVIDYIATAGFQITLLICIHLWKDSLLLLLHRLRVRGIRHVNRFPFLQQWSMIEYSSNHVPRTCLTRGLDSALTVGVFSPS